MITFIINLSLSSIQCKTVCDGFVKSDLWTKFSTITFKTNVKSRLVITNVFKLVETNNSEQIYGPISEFVYTISEKTKH